MVYVPEPTVDNPTNQEQNTVSMEIDLINHQSCLALESTRELNVTAVSFGHHRIGIYRHDV